MTVRKSISNITLTIEVILAVADERLQAALADFKVRLRDGSRAQNKNLS
jgi:hypothetical protein